MTAAHGSNPSPVSGPKPARSRGPARAPIPAPLIALLFAGLLAACTPAPAPGPDPDPAPPPGPSAGLCPPGAAAPETLAAAALIETARRQGHVRVIARLRTDAAPGPALLGAHEEAMALFEAQGVEESRVLSERLPLIVAEMDAAALEAMAANPAIAAWSEDRLAFPTLAESAPLIEAPEVHRIGGRGAGQAVAILDTGVDAAHPFLAGRVVAEACFSTTSAAQGARSVCPNGSGTDLSAGAARPCRAAGCDHGTHVAGIAAGRGDRFSGVAPDAPVIAVQVFSEFTGAACGGRSPCVASFTSDQIRALDHVADLAASRPVAAANMSLGGGRSGGFCDDELLKPSIDALRELGVATVIASGNDGFRDAVSFPGCISSAVTVGATSKQDRLAQFSNCGVAVDVHAPGVTITSSVPGGAFLPFSGTSMAAPHVAGAIAALKSADPAASLAAIEAALIRSGVDVGGRPRIRMEAARRLLPAAAEIAGAPESAVSPQNDSPNRASPPIPAALKGYPEDKPVRLILRVAREAVEPQGGSTAMVRAEAAVRAAGVTKMETIGRQPLLVIEATPRQAAAILASGAVSTIDVDRVSTTQGPAGTPDRAPNPP